MKQNLISNTIRLILCGLLVIATLGTFSGRCWAAPQLGGEEFVDKFNRMFEGRDPKVGAEMFSELSAFDEKGKKLKFDKLKGKHTVIVFGCLT
ncbi:MAG: hypothetical protein AAFN77_12080 [Planctomycetota bacterium]